MLLEMENQGLYAEAVVEGNRERIRNGDCAADKEAGDQRDGDKEKPQRQRQRQQQIYLRKGEAQGF